MKFILDGSSLPATHCHLTHARLCCKQLRIVPHTWSYWHIHYIIRITKGCIKHKRIEFLAHNYLHHAANVVINFQLKHYSKDPSFFCLSGYFSPRYVRNSYAHITSHRYALWRDLPQQQKFNELQNMDPPLTEKWNRGDRSAVCHRAKQSESHIKLPRKYTATSSSNEINACLWKILNYLYCWRHQ